MLAKAAGLEVDEVVIDLEDAVAPAAKAEARDAAVAALEKLSWRAGSLAVRVNPPGTPWCNADLTALATAPASPATVVVPKVESGGDLHFVERLLAGAEAAAGAAPEVGVQALIESAAGVARLSEIAAVGGRLEALILGYADLGASLGRPEAAADSGLWLHCQDAVLVAARAAGLEAIDGPYLGTDPDEPFRAAADLARALGFDGKWVIHPSQIEAVEQAFTPGAAEVEAARAAIAALEAAERSSATGAVAVDGRMIDEAVRVGAERTLARAAGRRRAPG